MFVARTVQELRQQVTALKALGRRIAFVPTMGCLHEGHLSLFDLGKSQGDCLVASIFVNPTQFNSVSDYSFYPRQLEVDLQLARERGVGLVFVPEVDEIFGGNVSLNCRVVAGSYSAGLCGATRPGHFDGVVTIVSILFHLVQPDVAIFGEKDYQQLKVITQLVQSLHFPVEIIPGPLVREKDGLAMSSRNNRLNPQERQVAVKISQVLFATQSWVRESKVRDVAQILRKVEQGLAESPSLRADYVQIVDVHSLQPLEELLSQAQLLVAVFIGNVRLIDNVRLDVSTI